MWLSGCQWALEFKFKTSEVLKESEKVSSRPLAPTRIAKIKNTDNTRCLQVHRTIKTLRHCWWEGRLVHYSEQTVWQFLIKLNITFRITQKTYSWVFTLSLAKLYTWILIAIHSQLPKTWNNPNVLSRWMDKQTIYMVYHRILLNNQKDQTINICNNLNELSWEKKPVSKGYTLCHSFHMTFSNRQNHSDRKQVRGLQGGKLLGRCDHRGQRGARGSVM